MGEVRWPAHSQRNKMALSVESRVENPMGSIASFEKWFDLSKEELQRVQHSRERESGDFLR